MNCRSFTQTRNGKQPLSLQTLIEWVKSLQIKARLKLLLRHLVDRYGKDGLIFPSVRTLASELCVARSSVHRWLNELTALNLISRTARYRGDGGRTSNLYVLECYRGVSVSAEHEQQINTDVIHAPPLAKDGVCIQQKEKKRTAKPYKINAEQMSNAEYAVSHYRKAVKQKWIADTARERLGWFASWAKCVRQWREGKVRNPGALMTKVIKTELHHKFPAEKDEIKALKILRQLVVAERLNPQTR